MPLFPKKVVPLQPYALTKEQHNNEDSNHKQIVFNTGGDDAAHDAAHDGDGVGR